MSRIVVLPTLTAYPLWGPTPRLLPLVDLACAPLPRSRAVRRSRVVGDTWTGERIEPRGGAGSDAAVLYLHGGAFLFGGHHSHRPVATTLAVETGMPVLTVGYRMFPQGSVSDALADCLEAFDLLVSQGAAPSRIVLAGDSAGGHLAFAAALALRDQGIDVAGIVGFSPWLDFDHRTKTGHANRRTDVMIPTIRLRGVARKVLGIDVLPEHSPVNADLRGLPPVFMVCADDEVLRADAELMRERLLAHGVPVELQIWSHTMHAFPAVPLPVPDFVDARRVAADFVRDCVEVASAPLLEVASAG